MAKKDIKTNIEELKKTIDYVAKDILKKSMPMKYAKAILNHKDKVTNHTLFEDVFAFILDTELWKTKERYCRYDVEVAIGQELLRRLNIEL